MKRFTIMLFLISIAFLFACKKEKKDTTDNRCHLPINGIVNLSGVDRLNCGDGGGVYPEYFCGPLLPTHTDKIVFNNLNHTLYIEENPGNIKGFIMDMGVQNCSYINENYWPHNPTEQVIPYVSGHVYFGLFPDGDTIRFYAETDNPDNVILVDFLFDTVPNRQHDTVFVGKYYREDNYNSGVIAYILQPGDLGYDANVQHGLIAATNDIKYPDFWNGLSWRNTVDTATGAMDSLIGSGLANTNLIVSCQGIGIYAARVCANVSDGGYTGWYLPSLNELEKLYLNRDLIGGFYTYADYWSSTEIDGYTAFVVSFDYGGTSYHPKDLQAYVRAVRSF